MTNVEIIFEGTKLTQTRFNEIERFVLEYFQTLWSEIRESIYVLRKNNPELVKSEVCLAMIGADSLSRFREIITDGGEKENNNEPRFRKWFDGFVLNDKNEVFRKYKKQINCDAYIAWRLRNSLLHFYGFPLLKSEFIAFGTLDEDRTEKLKKFVPQNHSGKKVRIINPYRLIEAVQIGFLTQLEILKEMIEGSNEPEKETYIKGIVKCYDIIMNEGSVHVPFRGK